MNLSDRFSTFSSTSTSPIHSSWSSDRESESPLPYDSYYAPFEMRGQCIVIDQSWGDRENNLSDTYYFVEILSHMHHANELGELYYSLFISSILPNFQLHEEHRQTSCAYSWHPLNNQETPNKSPPIYSKALQKCFHWPEFEDIMHKLEQKQECESDNLGRCVEYWDNYQSEPPLTDGEKETHIVTRHQPFRSLSHSSITYESDFDEYQRLKDCTDCSESVVELKEMINNMKPEWKPFFNQTRWSIRFAPQQRVDLTMRGIRIPPWRCSMARLLADLRRYCNKNREVKNLVLLDPMVSHITFALIRKTHYRHSLSMNECFVEESIILGLRV